MDCNCWLTKLELTIFCLTFFMPIMPLFSQKPIITLFCLVKKHENLAFFVKSKVIYDLFKTLFFEEKHMKPGCFKDGTFSPLSPDPLPFQKKTLSYLYGFKWAVSIIFINVYIYIHIASIILPFVFNIKWLLFDKISFKYLIFCDLKLGHPPTPDVPIREGVFIQRSRGVPVPPAPAFLSHQGVINVGHMWPHNFFSKS